MMGFALRSLVLLLAVVAVPGSPFATQTTPRLFVIDRKGLIRFEATG